MLKYRLLIRLVLLKLVVVVVIMVVKEKTLKHHGPDCDERKTEDHVEDPKNGLRYYSGVRDDLTSDQQLPCPQDRKFDAALGDCVPEGDPAAPHEAPTRCGMQCLGGEGEEGLVHDPFDCSSYYYCLGRKSHGPFLCPKERPYFNGDYCMGVNEAGEVLCCRHPCIPICNASNTQIPDPQDCQSFYVCTEAGPANPDLRFQCTADRIMDPVTGRCTSGSPCQTPCPQDAAEALLRVADSMEGSKVVYADRSEYKEVESAAEALERWRYDEA